MASPFYCKKQRMNMKRVEKVFPLSYNVNIKQEKNFAWEGDL
jgi:hypothetical protein